jgi:hypothetical protein
VTGPVITDAGLFVLFWCPHCGRYTPTIQRHRGYVPDFIACRAGGTVDNDSGKRADRVQGRPFEGAPTEPEWEWVAPFDRKAIPATENRAVEAAALNYLEIKRLRP